MLTLAWKNIWRNKVRSLIITFAIVFGVIGGVNFTAFYNGMIYQRLDMAIGNEIANIQVHHPNYLLNKEVNDTIRGLDSLCASLDTCKAVSAYSCRIKSVSMINSANSSTGIVLNGIVPENEKKVSGIYKYVIEGDYFEKQGRNAIVIGHKLAQQLKIKMRSKVVITMQGPDGSLISGAFKVAGIYKTDNTGFDERFVFARYTDLASLMGYSSPTAHQIAIALHNDADNPAVVAALKSSFPNLSVQPWREIMPELAMMTDSSNYMLLIFMVIIFLALSFGIINTMLMAVLDRINEIGMLMAIGMNKIKIAKMIMLETLLLVLTGSVIGLIISWALIAWLSRVGIDLSMFATGLSDMGFNPMVYPALDARSYADMLVLVFITALLSSIIPIRKALKLNPSEAIRKL